MPKLTKGFKEQLPKIRNPNVFCPDTDMFKIAHDKTSSEVGKGVDSLENVYSKLCQSCLEHCS